MWGVRGMTEPDRIDFWWVIEPDRIEVIEPNRIEFRKIFHFSRNLISSKLIDWVQNRLAE